MKPMILAGKVYIAIVALFLTYLGLTWAFFPDAHMARTGIEATTVNGLNTLKSVMGMGLLGVASFALFYLRDPKAWFAPLFVMVALILVIRVISLGADGFHMRMGIYAALELLILLVLLALRRAED